MGLTHVLALDCEMVGVGPGALDSKLASVCVVNAFGNPVYSSYARPSRPVTGYRTEFSGIEPHMLEDAPPVEAVQRRVRELVQGRVVVGHGGWWRMPPALSEHSAPSACLDCLQAWGAPSTPEPTYPRAPPRQLAGLP